MNWKELDYNILQGISDLFSHWLHMRKCLSKKFYQILSFLALFIYFYFEFINKSDFSAA